MAEYISREETINAIKSLESSMPAKDNYAKGYDVALGRVLIAVREVPPAADVQPVKRGKWIENTYKYIKELDAYFVQAKCTVCGRYSDKIDIYTGYMSNECCSHCGARMGQESDAE